MGKKEVLNFCVEKEILLDKSLLDLFGDSNDFESIKILINHLKNFTRKKIITKEAFEQSKSNQEINELVFKIGLNLEVCAKTHSLQSVLNEEKETNSKESDIIKVLTPKICNGKKFEVKDFVNYFRNRFNEMKSFLQENKNLNNLISINKINDSKQNFSIIGIIYNKKITKNKNIILEVEDLTGRVKLLVNSSKKEAYEKAENLSLDSIFGFKCSGNKEILFVNEIIFPEIAVPVRKKSLVEEYALFLGDLHYGSKKFLKNDFLKFIDYLNGKFQNTPEVEKIKYLFLVGDLVTGVGNYPEQEKDLEIMDLEQQFCELANILSKIPKRIKIIISPGNHDGVRLMEPQPSLDEKYAWALYELENVVMVGNPCLINIASNEFFEGFDVLLYHGFSYPYYANSVPQLMQIKSMNFPEKIIEYLLKQRHLAPTHSSVQYYPCEKDVHLINKIPDFFISAHTHKSSVKIYNNIFLISTSSWESFTPYQEKFGNTPDHCKIPMINLKTHEVKILDFENYNSKAENSKSPQIEIKQEIEK